MSCNINPHVAFVHYITCLYKFNVEVDIIHINIINVDFIHADSEHDCVIKTPRHNGIEIMHLRYIIRHDLTSILLDSILRASMSEPASST